jgi:predicted secreted protein
MCRAPLFMRELCEEEVDAQHRRSMAARAAFHDAQQQARHRAPRRAV